MSRILAATRYLIILPILGLLLAAGLFFVLGGIGLVTQLIEVLMAYFRGLGPAGEAVDKGVVIFMGAVFIGERDLLLQFGAGIGLPIAALGRFVGLRAWSLLLARETAADEKGWHTAAPGANRRRPCSWRIG